MESTSGTYALILHDRSNASVQVGRWGLLNIQPGFYLYIGSAFGPGGVRARVSRHCRKSKAKRWHVDYLREHADLIEVWYSHCTRHLEHEWAAAFLGMDGVAPVEGFGCSDCECRSHLFFSKTRPRIECFEEAVGSRPERSHCPDTMK